MRSGRIQGWDTYTELGECYKQGLSPANCLKRLMNHHLQNGKKVGIKLIPRTLKHMQKNHPELFLQLFPTRDDHRNLADIMIALEMADTNFERNKNMLNIIDQQSNNSVAIIAGENHMYGAADDLNPDQGLMGVITGADSSTSKPLAKLQRDITDKADKAQVVANQIPHHLAGRRSALFVAPKNQHKRIVSAGYWIPLNETTPLDELVCKIKI